VVAHSSPVWLRLIEVTLQAIVPEHAQVVPSSDARSQKVSELGRYGRAAVEKTGVVLTDGESVNSVRFNTNGVDAHSQSIATNNSTCRATEIN
jgi:hypothetical protein